MGGSSFHLLCGFPGTELRSSDKWGKHLCPLSHLASMDVYSVLSPGDSVCLYLFDSKPSDFAMNF